MCTDSSVYASPVTSDVPLPRYAWWSPTDKYEEATGPNALYYGSGEQTRLTGLGKIYLEKLCPANASSAKEL